MFRFFAILLALTVLGAQVIGMQRGYLCDCGGTEHVTADDHCHAPHEHDCDDHDHDSGPHSRDEHDSDEPIHEHAVFMEAFQAEKLPATAFSPPVAVVLVFLPLDLVFAISDFAVVSGTFHPPWQNSRAGPLWPPRLTQSISLRI